MLHDQREVTQTQPINNLPQYQDNWAFFSYENMYLYWEAFDVAVDELMFTILSGIVACTLIAFILMPHWTGALFVGPMICMLYINYLGTYE